MPRSDEPDRRCSPPSRTSSSARSPACRSIAPVDAVSWSATRPAEAVLITRRLRSAARAPSASCDRPRGPAARGTVRRRTPAATRPRCRWCLPAPPPVGRRPARGPPSRQWRVTWVPDADPRGRHSPAQVVVEIGAAEFGQSGLQDLVAGAVAGPPPTTQSVATDRDQLGRRLSSVSRRRRPGAPSFGQPAPDLRPLSVRLRLPPRDRSRDVVGRHRPGAAQPHVRPVLRSSSDSPRSPRQPSGQVYWDCAGAQPRQPIGATSPVPVAGRHPRWRW